jgi:ABC-type multidrug transport system ATPase subunit
VQQIKEIIVEINEQGTSVLLIEQNANMALSIAHHGYIMETGKIVMDGDPQKLLKDEDVQEFYLGLHGEGERTCRSSISASTEKASGRASATSSTTSGARGGCHEGFDRIRIRSSVPVHHGWTGKACGLRPR